jgi:hypothetical protein
MEYQLTDKGTNRAAPRTRENIASWNRVKDHLLELGKATREDLAQVCRNHSHATGALGFIDYIEGLEWIERTAPYQGGITLVQILNYLNDEHIRATYGAVAGVLGIIPQAVGQRLGPKTRRNSWVVNSGTGRPSGYEEHEIDELLESSSTVIRDGAELAMRVRRHFLSPIETAPQIPNLANPAVEDIEVIDIDSNNAFLNGVVLVALILAGIITASWILT